MNGNKVKFNKYYLSKKIISMVDASDVSKENFADVFQYTLRKVIFVILYVENLTNTPERSGKNQNLAGMGLVCSLLV